MLAALPVSPGPEPLPPGSPHGLFDRSGCPACRYVAEASDSYLDWFALAGHRDAGALARLSASCGMCPVHTRRLLIRPAAAGWLSGVYQHVIDEALRDIGACPAGCPACEHTWVAADRLLGFLIDEATMGDRRTYKEHGGLCLPHLRRAAVCRRGADLLWLVRFMILQLTAPSPGLDLLAGLAGESGWQPVTSSLPARSGDDQAGCVACRAAAEAARCPRDEAVRDCLCARHLREVVRTAEGGVAEVLAQQGALHAARLTRVLDGRSRRLGNYLSVRARNALADPDCPVCRRQETASERVVGLVARALREAGSGSSARLALCLRHARDVHAVDEQAARVADASLRIRGRRLIAEMTAAGEDVAGVQRAAEFLGGSA